VIIQIFNDVHADVRRHHLPRRPKHLRDPAPDRSGSNPDRNGDGNHEYYLRCLPEELAAKLAPSFNVSLGEDVVIGGHVHIPGCFHGQVHWSFDYFISRRACCATPMVTGTKISPSTPRL
jgi:hypothetical protein